VSVPAQAGEAPPAMRDASRTRPAKKAAADGLSLRLTLATVRQAVTGPRRSLAHTPFLTACQVWLDTDPPLQLDVDGEIRGRTPAQVTLEANALRVMVCPDFPDA
jgi:diacylglycerol kinase (ATP)